MYYCELIPRKNTGIIHLKLIVYLKDFIISYNKINKLINFKNIISEDSFNISPKYIYTNINNSYKFIITLNLPQHLKNQIHHHKILTFHKINKINEKIENNLDIEEILIKLIYINKEGYKIIRNFDEDLEEFVYIISCKDLIILEDNLQEINIRSINNFHLLHFRISIKFHHQLTFISLLTNSLNSLTNNTVNSLTNNTVNSLTNNTLNSFTSNTVNSFTSNTVNTVTSNKINSIIKCKNCENIIKELIDINLIILPSDLYLNSLNSIYCEECQFNPINSNSIINSKSDLIDNKNYKSNRNIGLISDDNLIISKESFNNSLDKLDNSLDSSLDNSLDSSLDRIIKCGNCNILIGRIENNKIIYKKNKISLIVDNFDIFYKFNDFIDIIEKIQFDPNLNLKLRHNTEVINIIKVSKQPDTFLLNNNNPIITTRLLYKYSNTPNTNNSVNTSLNSVNTTENTVNSVNTTENTVNSVNTTENTVNSVNTTENTVNSVNVIGSYQLEGKEFEHIKLILLIFSHDLSSNDWISSLLPQL